jgi:hypothetical protein
MSAREAQMGDNESMTQRPTEPERNEGEDDLDLLASSDPADAPQIAEDLADRLARELEGTSGPQTSRSEGAS